MALLDPRLVEIDVLSAADRATWSGGASYQHVRKSTSTDEDRQRDEAILGLIFERALVAGSGYVVTAMAPEEGEPYPPPDPSFPLTAAAHQAMVEFVAGRPLLNLRITQYGRLRLYRLRDEILSRDRIRDEFGVLWAHRHWLPDLTVRLRSREPGTPTSLLLLDVDHLKALNKELGNPGADKVLTGIFEELRDVVRPHEGYRLGGDEAGAILVGVPFDAAKAIGEEVRKGVRARAWPASLSFKTLPTVSVGVGTLTGDMDAEPFYVAADAIRDRAKATRDAVVAATVPEAAG
jgi:diguanylate cyclase (GGDEF)-like protein